MYFYFISEMITVRNGQKIAKSFSAFTLQEVLDLTVKCIGLKKGLCLVGMIVGEEQKEYYYHQAVFTKNV